MKIWSFPANYPYDYPGLYAAGIFSHRQNVGLIQSGADVEVIQPVSWNPGRRLSRFHPEWKLASELNYPEFRIYDSVTVHHPRISNLKPSRIFSRSYTDRYVDAVVQFFKKNKIALQPDDVFFSQWIPEAYHVQQAARKLNVRSAVMVIGDDVLVLPTRNSGYTEILRTVLTNADARLTVADYLGKEANKLLNANLHFHTIRRGVNYDFFKPVTEAEKNALRQKYNIPYNKQVVVCVGTPIEAKGWLDLLNALVTIKGENTDFLLLAVPGGSGNIDILKEAADRGLSDFVKCINHVGPDKMNEIYGVADIFCLPSHSEGIANAVVEAMSTGLPVITTNISGHPELIKNGSNGILVPAARPDLLATNLLHLINDDDYKALLGTNARNHIVNNWGSFTQNALKLYDLFRSL